MIGTARAVETPMLERFAGTPEQRAQFAALHPIGRVGRTEEIAQAVLFLADPANGFMTGASLLVDGGITAR